MENKASTYFEKQLDKITNQHYKPEYYYIHVRHSKDFMEQNLSEKIELDKIAASAFMSRFHYIRIFKQVYGITPREYLRDLRISKAKDLLSQGKPVSHVCTEVGYESLPTFSNAFKRGTGYSPKEYQQLNNSNLE